MTPIFVFGSNLMGIHGAGAAREALENWGAEWGVSEGLTGNSYAIPTKDELFKTLPLESIKISVDRFIYVAIHNPHFYFFVTPIGCGLAGYAHNQIAPLFRSVMDLHNVGLCTTWRVGLAKSAAATSPSLGETDE